MSQLRLYVVGQKWLGAEVFNLVQGMGHTIDGVCAPAPAENGDRDRLWDLAIRTDIPVYSSLYIPSAVDLIVAAHTHRFVDSLSRAKARFGAIGFHPSLLPLHRGRDAIEWAIRMRDRVTGGTIYKMTDQVDGGPIICQKHVFIRPDDSAMTLWKRELGPIALKLFRQAIEAISNGWPEMIDQDESISTWEPAINPTVKLATEMARA